MPNLLSTFACLQGDKESGIKAFGLRLRRLRDERNISQQELAYLANVAKPTIQRIEKGTTSVGLDVLLSLAEALDMTLHDLLKI